MLDEYNTRSSMGKSFQHRMLYIQLPIHSKVSWQDTLWVAQWEEVRRLILPGVWLQSYIYKKQQHLGKFQRHCDIGFLVGYSSKSKAYRVFNHATSFVEETYDVEFDESNGSQGAHENLDDVGDEPLREAMKNIPDGDIKPNDEEDDVQVINPPSSSVPHDGEKDGRVENKDTHVSHEQMVVQA